MRPLGVISIYFALFLSLKGIAIAQESISSQDELFTIDTPITIDLKEDEEEEEIIEVPKKKRKKKVFYGMKTKKGFTRKGYGDQLTIELFYYLKTPPKPNPYVRDIYWYDFKRAEIRKVKYDPSRGVLLHGPYKKMRGEQILEEGIFYVGTKHGRWMKWDKNDLLVDKEKYYKGWPRESLVSYYDQERSKMREIIPVEYGEKEGNYFYFHESGKIAVKGEYKWDEKVGNWTEYYSTGRRKRIIKYQKEPFDKYFRPFIWKEWNPRGKEIYNRDKMARASGT